MSAVGTESALEDPNVDEWEVSPWLAPFGAAYVADLRELITKHISPRFWRSATGEGMCAPAAEISARIFQRLGHQAFTLRVDAMFFNATALVCLNAQRDVTSDPRAWSVGAVSPDYHAVAIIDGDILYDPTSFQFSRPEREMELPTPIIMRPLADTMDAALPGGVHAIYRKQSAQPQLRSHLLSDLRAPAIRHFIKRYSDRTQSEADEMRDRSSTTD